MANLNRLFSVNISRQTRAASYANFGVGIILSPAPGFYGVTIKDFESITIEDVKKSVLTFSEYDDVIDAGVTGAALKSANAYFSQTPKPSTVVIADLSAAYTSTCIVLTGKDTGTEAVKAAVATVKGDEVHTATYDGTKWTGTAEADIKGDEQHTDRFQVSGRVVFVAGADVSVGLSVIAADSYTTAIRDIKHQNNEWFMQMATSRDPALLKQVADWTEAQQDKMAVLVDDGGAVYPDWPKSGITQYLFDKQMAGSFAITTRIESNYLDAAIAGRCLTMAPGSETWAIKALSGVQFDNFTETDYQTIKAINGNTYENYGSNVIVTYPGTTGSGEDIGVVRFCYWERDLMQKNLATLFMNQNKVGNDPEGIEVVCVNMEGSLAQGQTAGGIMQDFTDGEKEIKGYTVIRPSMSEISAAQRIKGDVTIKFNFYLRYAIKHVDAVGNALTYGI